MRMGNKPNVFRDENEKIFAINLGSDYCSEHEHGIDGLCGMIKVDELSVGVEKRCAHVTGTKYLKSFKTGNVFYILFDNRYRNDIEELKKDYKKGGRTLYMGEHQTFCGAWSDNDFGIAVKVKDKETYEFAKELAKAIDEGNFALWFANDSKGNPFGRDGLTIGITSRIPTEITNYMLECDLDERRLQQACDATGIKKLLDEKGKRYYYCGAKWLKEGFVTCNGPRISKHPVIYWLNPMDQENHDHGWWTVEELTDWANGIPGNKIDKVKKSETIKS